MPRLSPALLLCVTLVGCQRYASMDVDLVAYDAIWSARSLQDPRLGEDQRAEDELATHFDATDGLTVDEAAEVALLFNADLRVARLEANVPKFGARHAGLWDDPVLNFNVLRILENVKDPWILATSVSFTVPISGRLGVEKDKALAEADAAFRSAWLAEWELLSDLREEWARWSATRRRIAEIESYLKALDGIIALAKTQREANRIGAPQLRTLQIEHARRTGELRVLRASDQAEQASIKAMLGLREEAPVTLTPSVATSPKPLAEDMASLRLDERHPHLAVARAALTVADHAYRLELRKQYPDLVIGPGYENEEGAHRAGIVVSVPIPFLNRNRRAIAESLAEREVALARYGATYERLMNTLRQTERRVRAAAARSAFLTDELSPLVDQQLRDLRKLAELGDLDVLTLMDALTRSLEARQSIVDAQLENELAEHALRSLLRPLVAPKQGEHTNEEDDG